MASIQTSIELVDRMTGPLNRITSSIDGAISAYERLGRAGSEGFDPAAVEAARSAITRTIEETTRLGNEIEQNETSQNNFNDSVRNGTYQIEGMLGKLMQVAAVYVSMQGIKKVMDISDNLTQTTARLDMMNESFNKINGTATTTDETIERIYQSAQNARAPFSDMVAAVAKFGNNARDAFSSQEEVIDFANLVQKQMAIAGTSASEASNAMLQLSQALGSGVLRGDELNSIFEQAPNLIQSIADYLNVPIGKIRSMAREGQLSADIVKQAMFASADEINTKFENMPMTWNQLWTKMSNAALMRFQPILEKINELANSPDIQNMASRFIDVMGVVAQQLLNIFELAGSVSRFIGDNWSIIEPIVLGIAAALAVFTAAMIANTAAQMVNSAITAIHTAASGIAALATALWTGNQVALNAALAACPLTWMIALIIAVVSVIYAVCAAIAKMTGVANTGFGVMTGGINVVRAFFINLGLTVSNIALAIGGAISALANNMQVAFNSAISRIQSWFYDLLSSAVNAISGIAAALNKLPFVSFDYSGIVASADAFAAKSAAAAGYTGTYESIGAAFNKGLSTHNAFEKGWQSEAFKKGAAWGDKQMDNMNQMIDNFFGKGGNTKEELFGSGYGMSGTGGAGGYSAAHMPDNVADTASNTGKAADALEITKEDLKYLRDIAEMEVINRFTTAEIKVEAPVTANINNEMDLDGIVNHLTNSVNEAMEKAAEGVYL